MIITDCIAGYLIFAVVAIAVLGWLCHRAPVMPEWMAKLDDELKARGQ